MRVLVACEYSGTVRDAFVEKGHRATSCDILPTDSPGDHYKGDVRDILYDGWDLIIAHPPCTYLSVVGNSHFKRDPTRYDKRKEAWEFFKLFVDVECDRVCIENPVGCVNTYWRKPDQIIHPYMFGDPFMKRTCLWLRGLPKLYHTANCIMGEKVEKPDPVYVREDGVAVHWCEAAIINCKAKDVWKIRSKTFLGIAKAMAEQWG